MAKKRKLNLFDFDKWVKLFFARSKPMIQTAVLTGGERTANDIGGAIDFDIDDSVTARFIDNRTIKFSKQVNKTTQKRLNKVIKPIIAAGGNDQDVRKKIEAEITALFNISRRSRARMIARTETIAANNGGSLESMKQSGVVRTKEWLVSRDDFVRDTHKRANRQTRKIDKPFSVGGDKLQHPGDSSLGAEPEETINCRCIIIPGRIKRKVYGDIDDETLWKIQIAPTISQERRFFTVLRKLFTEQEKEVLRNAKKIKL